MVQWLGCWVCMHAVSPGSNPVLTSSLNLFPVVSGTTGNKFKPGARFSKVPESHL